MELSDVLVNVGCHDVQVSFYVEREQVDLAHVWKTKIEET